MNKGFTLIELLIVITITLIIGSYSAVFFSRFITQNSVANTQDQLVNQLRKAQIYAMMGNLNGNWGVNYSGNKITLYQGASYAARNTAFDENFSVDNSVNISGFTEVNFNKITGSPSATSTLSISGIGGTKTLSITSQGVINR